MSLRMRVLALVVLVGVTATAATAWLTLREASQQINSASQADETTQWAIALDIAEYGRSRGTWEGVWSLVGELQVDYGVRIRLVTEYGEVLVDSDHLSGRSTRPVASLPISIDPRPTLDMVPYITAPRAPQAEPALDGAETEGPVVGGPEADQWGMDAITAAYTALTTYRYEVVRTACLSRAEIEVRPTGLVYGVVRYQPVAAPDRQAAVDECTERAADFDGSTSVREFDACLDVWEPGAEQAACLQASFTGVVSEFAPAPLHLYLGAVDAGGPPAPLEPGPVLLAAALVAASAIGGTLLLSRRMLRPIGALTGAAGRLGAGDLSRRVPVVGTDELATLARAFNQMADSLQRGEERQRRLVADVAHELRTPLANLRGYLEALKDGVVVPDPELFVSLHEEALWQQRIVDDLQDLALAEAGVLVYHRVVVDLAELLATCQAAHQPAADAAEVRLVVSAPRPVPVSADPDRLRQVLGNLIANALRATPPGGEVRLRAYLAGERAVITVADTGSGIGPADLPQVFDRFWRGDPARGRRTGGSGLGLAIAGQIVADHGGTIVVRSTLGAGTTFTITLPERVGESAGDPRT